MIHLLAINRIPNIGPETKRRISVMADDLSSLRRLLRSRNILLSCLATNRGRDTLVMMNESSAERIIEGAHYDVEFIKHRKILAADTDDPAYPPLLKEIHDPPFMIYMMGDAGALKAPGIGVVGTRRPSGMGRSAAYESGRIIAENGGLVVSGLAMGVDRCAHEGALNGRGLTAGVLGSGIDCMYPASSRSTALRLLEAGGVIISEYPPGTMPAKYRFPERNRIISGLSRALLVIEAPERSGSLITADFCIEQNRDLFFHSAGIESDVGCGAERYIREGAAVVTSAEEVLHAAGWERRVGVTEHKDLMEILEYDLMSKAGEQ